MWPKTLSIMASASLLVFGFHYPTVAVLRVTVTVGPMR